MKLPSSYYHSDDNMNRFVAKSNVEDYCKLMNKANIFSKFGVPMKH